VIRVRFGVSQTSSLASGMRATGPRSAPAGGSISRSFRRRSSSSVAAVHGPSWWLIRCLSGGRLRGPRTTDRWGAPRPRSKSRARSGRSPTRFAGGAGRGVDHSVAGGGSRLSPASSAGSRGLPPSEALTLATVPRPAAPRARAHCAPPAFFSSFLTLRASDLRNLSSSALVRGVLPGSTIA